jgi:hypothetical protein
MSCSSMGTARTWTHGGARQWYIEGGTYELRLSVRRRGSLDVLELKAAYEARAAVVAHHLGSPELLPALTAAIVHPQHDEHLLGGGRENHRWHGYHTDGELDADSAPCHRRRGMISPPLLRRRCCLGLGLINQRGGQRDGRHHRCRRECMRGTGHELRWGRGRGNPA